MLDWIQPDDSAILEEWVRVEGGLVNISQFALAEMQEELDSISTIGELLRGDRDKAMATFRAYDQKAHQLLQLLSTVVKAMDAMRSLGAASRSGL